MPADRAFLVRVSLRVILVNEVFLHDTQPARDVLWFFFIDFPLLVQIHLASAAALPMSAHIASVRSSLRVFK